MKKILLSDREVWSELHKHASNKDDRIRAAIAYVTTSHLHFKEGDLLICDASDRAIAKGMTAANILRNLIRNNVDLYSLSDLHAKVAVIGNMSLIGSANMSNSGLCEATYLTDDIQLKSLLISFIDRLRRQAIQIDLKFIERILKIVVEKGDAKPAKKLRPIISSAECRTWFVSTRPLSNKLQDAEKAQESQGMKSAIKASSKATSKTKAKHPTHREGIKNGIDWIRMTGNSRFKKEVKPGDIIIECYVEKIGKKEIATVKAPAAVVYISEEDTCRRIFFESMSCDAQISWAKFSSQLNKMKILDLKQTSVRELKGNSPRILSLFEKQ